MFLINAFGENTCDMVLFPHDGNGVQFHGIVFEDIQGVRPTLQGSLMNRKKSFG